MNELWRFFLLIFGILFFINILKEIRDTFVLHWPWFALVGFIVILAYAALVVRDRDKTKRQQKQEADGARQHQERVRRKRQQEQQEKPQPEQPPPPPRENWQISSRKDAMEILELKEPFTLADVKKRRMDLLKKVHPDQGGSNMMARLVNEAYEVLKDGL